MRIITALLLTLCLAGCNRSSQNKDAVRQGIVDYLKAKQFNMATMDLELTSVQINDSHADATVSFYAKIAKLPRIVNVEEIAMGDAKEVKGKGLIVKTSCTVKTYMFVDKKP